MQLIQIQKKGFQLNGETVLLLGLWLTGIYAYLQARNFGNLSDIFPRFTSGILVITTTILLISKFVQISSGKADAPEEEANDDEPEKLVYLSFETALEDHRIIIPATLFAYIGFGYLIGLMWATPIFMLIYSFWTRQSWYMKIILTIIGFAVPYALVKLLNLRIQEGVIL